MIAFKRLIKKIISFKTKRKNLIRNLNTDIYLLENAIKLNIGGGKNHPKIKGWQVVDLRETADICLNITKQPLPFNKNSVDIIFTSHTLEHIYPDSLGFVLSEFYRVLKPITGLLRISVPDIHKACQAYIDNNIEYFKKSEISYADNLAPIGGLLSSWFYSYGSKVGNGHVHCFDFEYLKYLLEKNRFKEIIKSEYKKSQYEELRSEGFDLHPNDSLFVEARK